MSGVLMKTGGHAHRALAVAVLASVLALGCAPSASAVGTEVLGSMQARIDGEAGTWETLRAPSEGTATAYYISTGPAKTISIQGHDPDAGSLMRNVLSLNLTVMGEGASAQMLGDPSVGLYPEGLSGAFWQASAVDIEWDRLELGEDGGHATGRFAATLCYQESTFSEPDTDNCRALEGEFDTPLQAD